MSSVNMNLVTAEEYAATTQLELMLVNLAQHPETETKEQIDQLRAAVVR